MNQWLGIHPSELCRQHLLGVHGELHKFLPSWKKRQDCTNRVTLGQMQCVGYAERHLEIADEMLRRKMNHRSPLEQPDFSYLPVHVSTGIVSSEQHQANRTELARRCSECRKRMAT